MNDNHNPSPSAFAAAQIHLEEFIDLNQFPIHDLSHPRRRELVADCRNNLAVDGCSHVQGFILDSAIRAMCEEAHRLRRYARHADARVNPYLTAEDTSQPADHPTRFFETRTSSFINSDHLEEQSRLRKIYDSDVVVHFVADCLNTGAIYRWADPLGRNPYSVMHDGDYFPWHFDGNDYTVSILVQASESGGDFEYCPNIRTPDNENFAAVRKVLHGDRRAVKTLSLKTGDLQIFKGRYALHRVTSTRGRSPRIIALPTYVSNPYLVNRPHHAKAFYGRATPIHLARNLARLDNLTD